MKTIETLCVVCSMTSKGGWDGFGMNVEMWQHSEMRWGQDTRIQVTSSGEELAVFRKKRIKKSFGKQLGHSETPHSGLEINHVCLLYTQYTIHYIQHTTHNSTTQYTKCYTTQNITSFPSNRYKDNKKWLDNFPAWKLPSVPCWLNGISFLLSLWSFSWSFIRIYSVLL